MVVAVDAGEESLVILDLARLERPVWRMLSPSNVSPCGPGSKPRAKAPVLLLGEGLLDADEPRWYPSRWKEACSRRYVGLGERLYASLGGLPNRPRSSGGLLVRPPPSARPRSLMELFIRPGNTPRLVERPPWSLGGLLRRPRLEERPSRSLRGLLRRPDDASRLEERPRDASPAPWLTRPDEAVLVDFLTRPADVPRLDERPRGVSTIRPRACEVVELLRLDCAARPPGEELETSELFERPRDDVERFARWRVELSEGRDFFREGDRWDTGLSSDSFFFFFGWLGFIVGAVRDFWCCVSVVEDWIEKLWAFGSSENASHQTASFAQQQYI